MADNLPDKSPAEGDASHRRRKRYPGRYPRRFDQRYKEQDPAQYPQMQPHVRAQGRTPAGSHVPIMLAEVAATLELSAGQTLVDCTIGYGGHAQAMLAALAPGGKLIGFDVDAAQMTRTGERLARAGATAGTALSLHHGNFAGIAKVITAETPGGVDAIFADLGVSSMQIDDPQRGFSYKHDGPLDMRMDHRIQRTAADLLASLSAVKIATALKTLSDEPDSEAIADAIVRRRGHQPLQRTGELAELVLGVKGLDMKRWRQQIGGDHKRPTHPAARTFQALRILVNDELAALKELLRTAPACLKPAGRIAILTFHSGEDRLVKQSLDGDAYCRQSDDPLRPQPSEVAQNPRAAAAKLRTATRR